MSGHYYFVEKLKIVEKNLCKINCFYGEVSHILKAMNPMGHVTRVLRLPHFFFATTHSYTKWDIAAGKVNKKHWGEGLSGLNFYN